MFDLDLLYPTNLERAEALARRLVPNHPIRSEVEEKIRMLRSGYKAKQH